MLAFLLNFIPFVGNIVNLVLVAAVSLVTFDDALGGVAAAARAAGAVGLIESNVVTPLLVGRRLEINTVSQLITVAFWTWLWGVPGAILAVPFLVVVKAVTRQRRLAAGDLDLPVGRPVHQGGRAAAEGDHRPRARRRAAPDAGRGARGQPAHAWRRARCARHAAAAAAAGRRR